MQPHLSRMRHVIQNACVSVLLVAHLFLINPSAHADIPIVAAASNLKFVMEAIGQAYLSLNHQSVKFSYGSSGSIFQQIRHGAPFQVFLSAEEIYVQQLHAADLTEGNSYTYGIGRLVYFAPSGSTLKPSRGLPDLQQAVAEHRVNRFAIANPNHAPYGKAAMSTLRNLGLLPAIQPALVQGENVSQAAQFAISGATDGGLFAYSLVFSNQVSKRGTYYLVPESFHDPLLQSATLIKGCDADARRFFQFLQSNTAKAIFRQYGFVL